MIVQTRWVDRKFEFNIPTGVFPAILERFRGTPARLEDMITRYPGNILTLRLENGWSIQEHAGHLWDLEELGEKRLGEFLSHVQTLSAADMNNRKTYDAEHNRSSIEEILREFRTARIELTGRLEELDEAQAGITAVHPRLNIPMRLVDWVWFMCEHDDHHLARINGLARRMRL
jgi:uncharacterized damage-inducible protein DinB